MKKRNPVWKCRPMRVDRELLAFTVRWESGRAGGENVSPC